MGKILNRPITLPIRHISQFMKEMIPFIASIKVINPQSKKDVTNTLKCLRRLQVTLERTLEPWQQLQNKPTIQFLHRLNQDPLENYFSSMRQQGGNSDNPIPLQFCRGFQKLFYANIVNHSLGNCLQDLDFTLVNSNPKPTSSSTKASPKPSPEPAPFEVEDMDYQLHEVETNLAGLNAITYVAGYLLKKCLEKHRCDICAKCLVNLELDSSVISKHMSHQQNHLVAYLFICLHM